MARPDFHRPSGLRQPAAAGGAVARGDDAKARAVGGQAEAEHQQAASRAQGLPVPSARQDDRPGEPKPAFAKAGVWVADITYIPMRQGFLYLVAIIDWATRRVLSWQLSNTLTAGFCVEALSEALARFGKPDIFKIKGRNSPVMSSPRCCGIMGSRSAWTDAGAALNTIADAWVRNRGGYCPVDREQARRRCCLRSREASTGFCRTVRELATISQPSLPIVAWPMCDVGHIQNPRHAVKL